MPWQHGVGGVGGEIDDEGIPCYREVIYSTPRQSGKTIFELAAIIQRARGWADMLGEPQFMLYTAQTGQDARKKLLNDWYPILWPRRQKLGIANIARAAGAESVLWKNASRLDLMGSGEDAGHGKTVDMPLKDELFADSDNRRDQAIIPAMATRPFGQMWTASTMGTPASVAWNAKVALGRKAVAEGRTSGICYIEYSADPDADPADPETWWSCMPALGYTQSVESIQHAFDSMELNEFRRAFLNIATMGERDVIPAPSWAAVCSPLTECPAVVFGLDANPDHTRVSICAAGDSKLELIEARDGTGWVVDRCVELKDRYRLPFVIAKSGPAAAFITDLKARGVQVVELSPQDETRADQDFLDAVMNLSIEVKIDDDLDEAVRSVAKVNVGDAWKFGRRSALRDISPVKAASLGLFQSKTPNPAVFAY